MAEIVIPPITGEEIEKNIPIVRDALQGDGADSFNVWAAYVTASALLKTPHTMPFDENAKRMPVILGELPKVVDDQAEVVVDAANDLLGDFGSSSLDYALRLAQDRLLEVPLNASWPATSLLKAVTLETAKTMCYLACFDELLRRQPEGTVVTIYWDEPKVAIGGTLTGSLYTEGERNTYIPTGPLTISTPREQASGSYRSQLYSARLDPETGKRIRLNSPLSLSVGGVVRVIEEERVRRAEDLVTGDVPITKEAIFFGYIPDELLPKASLRNRGVQEQIRFDLVNAASSLSRPGEVLALE